jgi:hypothetical protein
LKKVRRKIKEGILEKMAYHLLKMTGICTTYSGFKFQPEQSTNGKNFLTAGKGTEHWSIKLKYFEQT